MITIRNKYTGEIDQAICLCSDGTLVELFPNGTWKTVNKDNYIIEITGE